MGARGWREGGREGVKGWVGRGRGKGMGEGEVRRGSGRSEWREGGGEGRWERKTESRMMERVE